MIEVVLLSADGTSVSSFDYHTVAAAENDMFRYVGRRPHFRKRDVEFQIEDVNLIVRIRQERGNQTASLANTKIPQRTNRVGTRHTHVLPDKCRMCTTTAICIVRRMTFFWCADEKAPFGCGRAHPPSNVDGATHTSSNERHPAQHSQPSHDAHHVRINVEQRHAIWTKSVPVSITQRIGKVIDRWHMMLRFRRHVVHGWIRQSASVSEDIHGEAVFCGKTQILWRYPLDQHHSYQS